jgi:hypothetical protein
MGLDADLRSVGDRPEHPSELYHRHHARLEEGLLPILDRYGFDETDQLVINKYSLSSIFKCEGLFAAGLDEAFEWSIPKARGTVIHKCLQRSITRRGAETPEPILVEQAVDRLKDNPDSSLSGWLQTCTDFEIDELVAEVTDNMVKLRGDWPPIQPRWQPRPESPARASLCDNRCVLVGKFDLALGQPRGQMARTFIADLKTGALRYEHRDEMMFYALLELLQAKVPPWRVATYYLDSGEWQHIHVDENVLAASVQRVIDGAEKIAALIRRARDPELRASGACTYCSALPNCEVGEAWKNQRPTDER